ncbi:MAG: alpha/beta fold hydrolase [Gemmataceae bacterium]|nr:alpha/beta fold hydrolase [Gemmataceae bacterium]
MTRNSAFTALVAFAALIPSKSWSQADRYDLGLRLRALEEIWDQSADEAARKRAVGPLNQAVRAFFSFNNAKVGEWLDRASHALKSGMEPPAAQRWAESLVFRPARRLVGTDETELKVEVRELYSTGVERPQNVAVSIEIPGVVRQRIDLNELPFKLAFRLGGVPAGEHLLSAEVTIGSDAVLRRRCLISRVDRPDERLAALREAVKSRTGPESVESATLAYVVKLLSDLRAGQVFETDYPAARLIDEMERLREAVTQGELFFRTGRSGEFWLRIPTNRSAETVRFFAPEMKDDSSPRPIVVALHGAGASENMFFDSYGNGITKQECEKRGWFLVAPRTGGGLGVGGTPNVLAIIEELSKRYPIDSKRVYVVGHSMGAGQALALSQQNPEKFAGVAALGGGGMIRKPEAFQSLPLFVGIGTDDFLIGSAKRLSDSLKRLNLPRMQFKEYPNVEHMMIVREAIPDVFRFWTTAP